MKKMLLVLILIAAIGISQKVKSQVLIGLLFGEALNKGPIEFGLNIIGNYSRTTIDNGSDPRNKLGFGLYMDYKINKNLIVSGSFFFASPKGEKHFNENDPLYFLADSLLTGATTERVFNYFEFPVMFEYRAFNRIGIGLGGYLSYLTRAYDYYEVSGDFGKILHERSILDEMNRLDYGLISGLHYHFKGDPGAQIQVSYLYGLAELFKESSYGHASNQTLQLGVLIPIKFGLATSHAEENAE